jgi:transketolase
MAHADRCLGQAHRRIFVMISDGELQEGSTWENMMMAANLGTRNLVVLLDHNGSQSFGHTRETHPKFYPIREKVEAFGWECAEVNGHDVAAIHGAVSARQGDKPFMLIGNTVKGRGVSFMEGQPIWHYRSPNPQEYLDAIQGLVEVNS